MFTNLKIGKKLLVGFGVVIVLAAIMAVVGVYSSITVDQKDTYVIDNPDKRLQTIQSIQGNLGDMRRACALMALYSGDTDKINSYFSDYTTATTGIASLIDTYNNLINSDSTFSASDRQTRLSNMANFQTLFNAYQSSVGAAVQTAALANDMTGAKAAIENNAQQITDMSSTINDMATSTLSNSAGYNQAATNYAQTMSIVLVVVGVVIILFAIIIALIISRSINKPLNGLVQAADDVKNGKLNVNIDTVRKDEIGDVGRSLSGAVAAINSIVNDLDNMAEKHDVEGDIDAFVDDKKYQGTYAEMVRKVNQMVSKYIEVDKLSLGCLSSIGAGNFEANIDKLPGKKIFINDTIEQIRASIKSVGSEIQILVNEALKGNLSVKAKADNFTGDWQTIVKGLNDVLENITAPVIESSEVLQKVARGDLSVRVTGSFKGDLAKLSGALNSTVDTLSTYIGDISHVLGEIANANLNLSVDREYLGDFGEIKTAMNTILSKLNDIMSEIGSATEQVMAGAKNISESSMSLATGATEQASSVQELSATVDSVDEKTNRNAKSAERANKLSETSRKHALDGDSEMKEMLVSMEGIKESSGSISKIIKTIEDIAFQTNLLALNAAVEAARAGEHGKGFAVVAEEVRNLAARSQKAAGETTELIEDSIQKVNKGTEIAQATAASLQTIVEGVNEVSDIIKEIAVSSVDQAEAISNITIGIGQISTVVQNNSATSEEAAAASEELSSQADTLREMVANFKLKKRR